MNALPAGGAPLPRGGRYELLDRLGSGGMADVFLALAKGPFDAKKLVVLKRPRAASHEYAQMFMDEARLTMRLNHPNVVQTYEVGFDDGGFFLAMEYLEGQPLHRVVAAMQAHDQHLSHAHVARLVSDVLAGLSYAHDFVDYDGTPLHIVHRDVSPHNVFVTYEGQVKVVDFGIAKATMNEVHTQTGDVKGKLAYMAPEQAVAGEVDPRADLFSVGVMLWEILARRRLFGGQSSGELLDQLLTMDIPPLSVIVPDVHPVLEAVVLRALARERDDRFSTAREMREALESYIGIAGQPVRASDLGGLVSRLFSGARSQAAARIRAQMQPGALRPRDLGGSVPGLPVLGQAPPPNHYGPAGDTAGPSVITAAPVLLGRRAEWRTVVSLIALGVSVLVLAGALLLVMVRTRRHPVAAVADGTTLVGVPAVVPGAADPAPTDPPPPA
ncbi:MAG: Protein kinase, partial [Labilithrix sp.]|nr:Protein kinase [Labilithrix sp.]